MFKFIEDFLVIFKNKTYSSEITDTPPELDMEDIQRFSEDINKAFESFAICLSEACERIIEVFGELVDKERELFSDKKCYKPWRKGDDSKIFYNYTPSVQRNMPYMRRNY